MKSLSAELRSINLQMIEIYVEKPHQLTPPDQIDGPAHTRTYTHPALTKKDVKCISEIMLGEKKMFVRSLSLSLISCMYFILTPAF